MFSCLDSPTAPLLFDTAFLSKLEQLHLLSKKLLRSQHRAERPSRQIGSSLEFADYRNYAPGDDLRGVDWNIYGRLEKLSVKLFEQEQDLPVYLLVDASESMRWVPGATSPQDAHAPRSKFDQVRRTAASLAYVALANLDRVGIQWFGSQLGPQLAMTRGRSQFHKVLDFLQTAPPLPGPTCLLDSAREFTQRTTRRGMVILLSDLLDPAGCAPALTHLQRCQFEVQVVQILAPEELDPAWRGDIEFLDAETGAPLPVTLDETLLASYRERVAAFLKESTDFCRRNAVGHVSASTAVPFEDLVLRVLREGRLLR